MSAWCSQFPAPLVPSDSLQEPGEARVLVGPDRGSTFQTETKFSTRPERIEVNPWSQLPSPHHK